MYNFYYDRQGRPLTSQEWEAQFAAARGSRRVAETQLDALGWVSTVFLGLNHAYDDGPPLIFETMVFGGPMADYIDRYSTEEQALAGHEFVVQALMYYQSEKRPALIHNGRKPRK